MSQGSSNLAIWITVILTSVANGNTKGFKQRFKRYVFLENNVSWIQNPTDLSG